MVSSTSWRLIAFFAHSRILAREPSAIGSRLYLRMHSHSFPLSLTSPGAQPEFYCDCVNGKANPKSDHRPRCSDAEQYCNCPRHPAPLQKMLDAAHIYVGARQRKQEQAVEEKH